MIQQHFKTPDAGEHGDFQQRRQAEVGTTQRLRVTDRKEPASFVSPVSHCRRRMGSMTVPKVINDARERCNHLSIVTMPGTVLCSPRERREVMCKEDCPLGEPASLRLSLGCLR